MHLEIHWEFLRGSPKMPPAKPLFRAQTCVSVEGQDRNATCAESLLSPFLILNWHLPPRPCPDCEWTPVGEQNSSCLPSHNTVFHPWCSFQDRVSDFLSTDVLAFQLSFVHVLLVIWGFQSLVLAGKEYRTISRTRGGRLFVHKWSLLIGSFQLAFSFSGSVSSVLHLSTRPLRRGRYGVLLKIAVP